MYAPPAVIFLNGPELQGNILETIQRQLFISETIDQVEFDLRVANVPEYIANIKLLGLRVLVLIDFRIEPTNRDLADIVVFASNGMLNVLKNNFGPPELVFPLTKIAWKNFGKW